MFVPGEAIIIAFVLGVGDGGGFVVVLVGAYLGEFLCGSVDQ